MTCDPNLAVGVLTVVVIILGWEGAQLILHAVLNATLGRWLDRRNGGEG
jgi:hypothetical protein